MKAWILAGCLAAVLAIAIPIGVRARHDSQVRAIRAEAQARATLAFHDATATMVELATRNLDRPEAERRKIAERTISTTRYDPRSVSVSWDGGAEATALVTGGIITPVEPAGRKTATFKVHLLQYGDGWKADTAEPIETRS